MENNLSRDLFYRWVIDTQLRRIPANPADQPRRYVTMACFHCADPACVAACPVGGTSNPGGKAIFKDTGTGAVIIDQATCIGCKYCRAACPYGAPVYNPTTGKMEKCHFCQQRLNANLKPACVLTCVGRALDVDQTSTPGGTAPAGLANSTLTHPAVLFS
jgi:anaerobic dimethyl sulfoxide reductase subunit B (iron-sulfur subunit)